MIPVLDSVWSVFLFIYYFFPTIPRKLFLQIFTSNDLKAVTQISLTGAQTHQISQTNHGFGILVMQSHFVLRCISHFYKHQGYNPVTGSQDMLFYLINLTSLSFSLSLPLSLLTHSSSP